VPKLPSPATPGQARIAPSILSADYARLADEIASVRAEADALHVDVMDAHFVPNLTIGPPVVAWVRKHTDLYLDCHLMMDNPGDYLEAFRDAGADGCSVHVEVGGTGELLGQMRSLGLGVGLVLNPGTPFEQAEPWLGELDLLLLMTVHPGFGGQRFIEEVLPKVAAARRAIDERGLSVDLEVDGGVGPETAGAVALAGARLLVAGSAIFDEADRLGAARRIRAAANAALKGDGAARLEGRTAVGGAGEGRP
jgi:ribulose-phosphate 3-epimerase